MNQDIWLRNNNGIKSKANLIKGFIIKINQFDFPKETWFEIQGQKSTIIIGQSVRGSPLYFTINT